MKKNRRGIWRWFILLLYCLVLLEIGARIFLTIMFNDYFTHNIAQPYGYKMKRMLYDSIKYKMGPLCMYKPYDGLFRYKDGFGCWPKEKAKNELRIMCVGDSTTFCIGINDDQTWPALLGEKLKRIYPDKCITVLNAGYPGFSARDVKRIYQFELVDYNPDIVLFRKELSDLTDQYYVKDNISWFGYMCLYVLSKSKLFAMANNIIEYKYSNNMFDAAQDFFSASEQNGKIFRTDWKMIEEISAEHGIKHIAIMDYLTIDKEYQLQTNYMDLVSMGVEPVIKTYDGFRQLYYEKSREYFFYDNEHLTPQGTTLIADEVCDFLVEQKWM